MTEPVVAAQTYARWRATTLGAIIERVETSVVFDLAGPLVGLRGLDVGTGDGTDAIEAAARDAVVTALDLEPEMLDTARSRAAARGVDITLIQGRAERLPFDDASFDAVLAATVLCFVPDAGRTSRPWRARSLQRVGGRAPRAGVARCGHLATSAILVTLRAGGARTPRGPPRR